MSGQGDAADEDMDEERELFGQSDDEEPRDGPRAERDAERADGAEPDDGEGAALHGIPHPTDSREPVILKNPVKPSAEEVEKHNATHLPYRSWCDVCVRAVGREDPHRRGEAKRNGNENSLPKVSMDYQELISRAKKDPDDDDAVVKIIVAKDEPTGTIFAYRVNQKGSGDEWVIRRLVQDIADMGRTDIVLKTDGEPAMISLQKAIQAARTSQTVPENPPAYNPQSNGACEKAVQDTDGQIRKLKLALEARLKFEVSEDSNVMQWMIPHAAHLLSKYSIGHDGMTPHERLVGRKWVRPIVEFGEVVLAKLTANKMGHGKRKQQRKKLVPRSIRGMFVGQIARTGEQLIAKQSGDVVRCRTIRRVPFEKRWDPEMVLNIMGVPRLPAPSQRDPDVVRATLADEDDSSRASRWRASRREEVAERRRASAAESGADIVQPEARAPREHDLRRLRITDTLLGKYGYTDDCAGCQHKVAGRVGHRPHSQACRERLYGQMMLDEQDKEKLIAEDVKMQVRQELTGASKATQNEPNATAATPGPSEPAFESALNRDKLEVIPEGEDEDGALDNEMPELKLTYDSDDDMDVDAEGDPATDKSGIPELTEDNVLDQDVADISDDDPDTPRADGGDSKEPGVVGARKRQDPGNPRGGAEDPSSNAKRKRVGRLTACESEKQQTAEILKKWLSDMNLDPNDAESATAKYKQCINAIAELKQRRDVKEIIQGLEKKYNIALPKNRRQRRTLAMTGKYHICEAYSPPRMTARAAMHGLKPGWAYDLTRIDEDDGMPWDLSRPDKQRKVKKRLAEDEPVMLIVSPMCGPFSTLQSVFNYPKLPESEVESKLLDAMEHVRFCLEICLEQYRNGRLFVFEHPAGAASWGMEAMKEMKQLDGVRTVKFDFCMLGMVTHDEEGHEAAAQKRTQIMTNSQALATVLSEAQCRGEHRHAQLLGGRAKACQEYPDKFCDLVCMAVKRELETVRWRDKMNDCFDITKTFGKLLSVQQQLDELPVPPEEDQLSNLYLDAMFVDDMSGNVLDKQEAIAARRKELEFFKRLGVYTKVQKTAGMKIISTKWLDVNKGDEDSKNYRARLVGREIAHDKRDDLFAATPPLESLRMILSICASNQNSSRAADNFVIMSNDVKRAYFYAPTTRPIYIRIPAEDWEPGDEERVGKLNLSLYGTRDAAKNWAAKFTEVLEGVGFRRGTASPCNFVHEGRRISLTVHGDDFTSTGPESELRWLEQVFARNFEIKTDYLGPSEGHAQEIRILNRVIQWTADGLTYEADQRHAEILIKDLELEDAKPVATPGAREDVIKASHVIVDRDDLAKNDLDDPNAGDLLDKAAASRFRGLAARANFLSQDRADIQYATKEVARRMARPRDGDWSLLKRLARYLVGAPRLVYEYRWQSAEQQLEGYVDSDWGGCKGSRRSTSGGVLMSGQHVLKTWSTTQATIALSSAEAELFAMVKGAAQALGMLSIGRDLGLQMRATLHSDSSAALGIIQRQGVGKLRHISTQYLWIQEKTRREEFDIAKVPGEDNPADVLTKNVPSEILARHLHAMNMFPYTNRANSAPKLAGIKLCNYEAEGDPQGGPKDNWYNEQNGTNGTFMIVRTHDTPRTELFTPMRVKGAPPARTLTSTRITSGRYVDDGEAFTVTDSWRARATAHRQLERPWIGSTAFFRMSDDALSW